MERGLRLVQSLDPPGVGARDLAECLLLQLERLPERDALAETIEVAFLGSSESDHPRADRGGRPTDAAFWPTAC